MTYDIFYQLSINVKITYLIISLDSKIVIQHTTYQMCSTIKDLSNGETSTKKHSLHLDLFNFLCFCFLRKTEKIRKNWKSWNFPVFICVWYVSGGCTIHVLYFIWYYHFVIFCHLSLNQLWPFTRPFRKR